MADELLNELTSESGDADDKTSRTFSEYLSTKMDAMRPDRFLSDEEASVYKINFRYFGISEMVLEMPDLSVANHQVRLDKKWGSHELTKGLA